MKPRGLSFVFWLVGIAVLNGFAARVIDRQAQIKMFVGRVEIRKGESNQWQAAGLGMKLRSGDVIRTFVESRAELQTSEGSLMKVGENTTFELSKMQEDDRTKAATTQLRVISGNVWANVKKLSGARSDFTFETPTATASIRGTQLEIDVREGRTRIAVFEGVVYVQPLGARNGASLRANQMAVIRKNQAAVNVEQYKPPVDAGRPVPADTAKTDTARRDTTGAAPAADTTAAVPPPPDTTAAAPPPPADTLPARRDTVASAGETSCVLEVDNPADGSEVKTEVPVNGRVCPGGQVRANGQMAAVGSTGSFTLSLKVPAGRQSARAIVLTIAKPAAGDQFTVTRIPVEGLAVPGAKVLINGMEAAVAGDGSFRGTCDIPAEDGTYEISVTASLEAGEDMFETFPVRVEARDAAGRILPAQVRTVRVNRGPSAISGEKNVTRSISYKKPRVPIYLTASVPATVTGGTFTIRGKTNGSEVLVNGEKAFLTGEDFLFKATLDDRANSRYLDWTSVTVEASGDGLEPGEMEKAFSVKMEANALRLLPAVNTAKPILRIIQGEKNFQISGQDATFNVAILDEALRYKVFINNTLTEEDELANNGTRTFDYDEGLNVPYRVELRDAAGNLAVQAFTKTFLSSLVNIRLVSPASPNAVILSRDPPPNPPGITDPVVFEMEFNLENVPDDNVELIREVLVTVAGTSAQTRTPVSIQKRLVKGSFTDLVFDGTDGLEFEFPRERGLYTYSIKVTDINNRKREISGTLKIGR